MSDQEQPVFNSLNELIQPNNSVCINKTKLIIKDCRINFAFNFNEFIRQSNINHKIIDDCVSICIDIDFSNVNFTKDVFFINTIFERKLILQKINAESSVKFQHCRLEYKKDIRNPSEVGFYIVDSVVKHAINISLSYLNCNTSINNITCKNLYINESEINAHTYIDEINTVQYKQNIENRTKLLLSNLRINYKLILLKTHFSNVDFSNIIVGSLGSLMFLEYNVSTGIISMEGSYIDGKLMLLNVNCNALGFKDVFVFGGIFENDVRYEYINDECALILKQQAQKRSDTYLISKHKAEELNHLLITLTLKPVKDLMIKSLNNTKSIKEQFLGLIEKIKLSLRLLFLSGIFAIFYEKNFVLWMNKYSNNFGLSWFRGAVFTICVSFLFYTLYIITIQDVVWFSKISSWLIFDAEYWKRVIEFLWLPSGLNELTELNKLKSISLWSYLWFVLGKIFVAYGMYQTISAFRKYGK